MSKLGRLLALATCGSVLAAPAAAQEVEAPIAERPTDEEARRHFEVATAAFENGDYPLAVRAFERTHELAPHPDLLFNIYSAAERGGMLEVAADALERYLAEGDPGERRVGLVSRLERLRERIREQRADGGAEAPETQDGRAAQDADDPPVRVPSDAPVAAEPGGGGLHPAAVALLVVGGALLASFGVFAGLAAAEDASLASSCGRDAGATCSPGAVSTLEAFTLVADISWIAGAAAAATGLILLFVLPAEAEQPSVALAPWARPDGAGLMVRGTL